MEVIIAKKAGFCFGVRRAIENVEGALAGETPVYSLGPVIHNPQVIRQLKEGGLREEEDLEAIGEGVVVIRSHGAPLHIYRAIEEKGLTVVDTTCPFVKKMHRKARSLFQEGYQVIIVGDRHHPEITSLTDDPHFQALVVSRASELDGVELSKKIGLISQTTQPTENFNEVADQVADMYDESFARMWRLYLAGSAAAFETGTMQLYQLVFVPQDNNSVPMTRAHQYQGSH